jgi:hypothetical protein
MFEVIASVVPVVYFLVSFVTSLLNLLAYGARSTRDPNYRKYFRWGKIFIWIASGLIVLVGVVALFGLMLTPHVITDSRVLVWGAGFHAAGIIAWMANERSRPS